MDKQSGHSILGFEFTLAEQEDHKYLQEEFWVAMSLLENAKEYTLRIVEAYINHWDANKAKAFFDVFESAWNLIQTAAKAYSDLPVIHNQKGIMAEKLDEVCQSQIGLYNSAFGDDDPPDHVLLEYDDAQWYQSYKNAYSQARKEEVEKKILKRFAEVHGRANQARNQKDLQALQNARSERKRLISEFKTRNLFDK